MKPKIIVYQKVQPEVLDFLKQSCHVCSFEELNSDTYPEFYRELREAEGLIGSGLKVDRALLEGAPHLKIVSNISVGYDNFNVPDITANGVMATNTPGVLNETVADAIFGLMLAAARRMPELNQYVKEGRWKASIGEDLFGIDVHHKVLGIIGMGGIGSAIAKRAHHGFDMPILYHNRTRRPEAEQSFSAAYCSLEDLCRQADFICLMTPLTPETKKLIGEKEFKLMKNTAVFINGSRGATVDENALVQALQNKEILAAGLDVFEHEPVRPDHPLLSMDNVVSLPHIGSATKETRLQMAMLAAENLVQGVMGKMPPNLINPEAVEA